MSWELWGERERGGCLGGGGLGGETITSVGLVASIV